MIEIINRIPNFLLLVFSSLWGYVTGGTVGLFIWIWEKYYKKEVDWRFIKYGFIAFLIVAFFMTWANENMRVDELENLLKPKIEVSFDRKGGSYYQEMEHQQLYRIKITNKSIKPVENVQARLIRIEPMTNSIPTDHLVLHFMVMGDDWSPNQSQIIPEGREEYVDVVGLEKFGSKRMWIQHSQHPKYPYYFPKGNYDITIQITGNNIKSEEHSYLIGVEGTIH